MLTNLMLCWTCGALRPINADFCPHCSWKSKRWSRWFTRALGVVGVGTATACCLGPSLECTGLPDGGTDCIEVGAGPGDDAGTTPDAGTTRDAGLYAPDSGVIRTPCQPGGPVGADYGIAAFIDGGCE